LTIRTAKTAGCLERRQTRAKFVEFVAAGFTGQCRHGTVYQVYARPMTVGKTAARPALTPLLLWLFFEQLVSIRWPLFALRRLETFLVVRHLI
jgi:hypothetical protein